VAGINAVTVLGNLTRDPELRHTAGGTAVCELSIAVNSREKKGDAWEDRADFFDIVVYGNQADACAQYLAKGRQCAVSGRLRQDRWEKDGAKRSKVVIIAREVQFIGGRRDGDGGAGAAESGQGNFETPTDFGGGAPDDDIPF
jgi:single-strand DNA-binding protein